MGYDLHITRASTWLDAESSPITLKEWIAYVEQDAEMRLDGFAEAEVSSGEILRTESPGLAVWTAWSQRGVDGGQAWFDHYNGCVVVKDPDEEIIQKMISVAAKLDARVVGDEGETYPTTDQDGDEGESYPTTVKDLVDQQESPSKRPWWRRLFE